MLIFETAKTNSPTRQFWYLSPTSSTAKSTAPSAKVQTLCENTGEVGVRYCTIGMSKQKDVKKHIVPFYNW